MNSKRKGFIVISNEVYSDCWKAISQIFTEFKPSHIEYRHWENGLWYFYGTSDWFEELIEGQDINRYDVLFDTKNKTFTFKKA